MTDPRAVSHVVSHAVSHVVSSAVSPTERRARLVVLASGRGSNVQAIIDASRSSVPSDRLDAEVVAVISDQPTALALQRALDADIDAVALPRVADEQRADYDERLSRLVRSYRPDVVVLAGWMRILSMAFLGSVDAPVVNLHPALPGELPGTNAIERAFAERERGRRESGVMVHLVPDEGVDDGPVLAVTMVPIEPDDTLETFAERMHAAEHRLLVDALRAFIRSLHPVGSSGGLTERTSP